MKEKIDGIMRDETLTRYEKTDQILALLSGEMEKAENHYRPLSNILSESQAYFAVEEFRHGLLALLRGDKEKGQ